MIAVEDHGRAGTDIVLIHGVGLDPRMWDRVWPELTGQHRVRLVTLRGHVGSPAAGPDVTLDDLARDLLAVLDGPSHLVGFSLGALVATQAALLDPAAVASLTLVSSVAKRTAEETAGVVDRLRLAESDFTASVDAAIERWFTPHWRSAEPDLVADVRRTLLANDHASYLACYGVFTTADQELWPRLGELQVPTIAVTGGADPGSTPAMTETIAAAIPGARARVIDDARHLLALEAPQQLAREILQLTAEVDRDRAAATA